MTKNSPLSMQVSKSYQILIFALICGVVFITAFFAILCVNENKAIEMRHLARIDYAGDAIKNAIQVANNVMYAYESRYDDGLIHILHDFNEKFIQVYGDLDQIHLDALKQEYEIIHPQGVVLYILDSKNTIIASTNPAEIGYNFSNIPEFAEELTQIYNAKWAVLDITSRNQQSGEMLKYGYISSYDHDYLLEAGIAVSDLFIPDDSRYTNLDPNIITTPNSVFLFSKSAVLEQNPDKGLLQLGGSEQTLPDFTKRVDYISRAFSEKSIFSIDNFEEKKRINYYFISYPAEDAPSHSFASQVLEVTADLTPLHDEIFRNTLILSIITIICDLVFISMILIIIRFVVYPINQIIDDIEIIANGNYDHKIKQTKGPEFDRLEISIAKMISAFQEQNITLLQKNSSLHALMEASVHGILTVDSHVHVHHFNTIFCDMWGLLEDEIYVGADGSDILVRCANQTIDPELFMSNIRTVFNSPDVFWNMHVYLSDGKIFQSASSPICGSDGTYYGRIWEVIDITERVQKEQELEAAYLNIEAQNEELLATEEALRHHNSLLKETESELIRQNSILVTLQEHLAGGFYVFSENKKIVSFNQKFLDLFGFSREELEQNRDLEYVLQGCALYQDATEQRALIEELIHDRTSSSHDEVVLVDGTILERHSTPIIDKNGIYRGRLREFIDITERVQKEQELEAAYLNIEAQNEELLATEEALRHHNSLLKETESELIRQNSILVTLQEHLAGGFYVFSENKKIVSFNQKFLDLFGFSREELEQNRDLEYLLRACALYQDATEQRALIEELIHDRTSSSHDEVVLVDGTILERHSTPIIDKNGIYRGRLREFIDITEHVQKEQELEAAYLNIEAQNEELLATEEALRTQYSILQEKDNHLTLALEGTGKGLWTWDASTEQLTLNPAFTSRYRSLYREQSIDSFISAIHPDERELCLNILREIRKMDPDASIEFEFQLQSNEGMWRWIMSRGIVSEKDDDGVPMMITGTFVDITERRQHEKHLREVNRKMLMLSQITRHDIVNKLNNLFMISDGLSAELSDTPYDMVSIKNLLELMEYGLTTVMRQMEFSRDYQELGVHGAEWQDVAVCIENVRPFLIHPPVELVVDNLPMIFADPLLEKAVYNLFENSLRHGGDVSLIKVTFSADDYDNGILVFEDNGVGVLDKDKEKIFEKDFGKNTGLGLFLIREIFGLTEMTIRECGEPGHGARFEITIPAGYWRL